MTVSFSFHLSSAFTPRFTFQRLLTRYDKTASYWLLDRIHESVRMLPVRLHSVISSLLAGGALVSRIVHLLCQSVIRWGGTLSLKVWWQSISSPVTWHNVSWTIDLAMRFSAACSISDMTIGAGKIVMTKRSRNKELDSFLAPEIDMIFRLF